MTARKTLLHRARNRLSRLSAAVPLTASGAAVLLLALSTLYFFGYQRMDLVVFALAVCALIIVLAAVALTTITGVILRRRPALLFDGQGGGLDIRVEAGYPNETGFACRPLPWLPLVSLQWRVTEPDTMQTGIRLSPDGHSLEEEVIPSRRCLVPRVQRRFVVADVLGLARHGWTVTRPDRLVALPRAGRLRRLPLLRSLSAEDGLPEPTGDPVGDRMEIRPYAPGDPVRNILWNVYARTRQLNIRLEEKSLHHSQRTLAYLIGADDDEAAAAAARVAIEGGALGDDWLFATDRHPEGTWQRPQALEQIAASRILPREASPPWQGSGLLAFLRTPGAAGAHCIVFAPPCQGPWIGALQQACREHAGRFSVVLCTDGFREPEPPRSLRRLLFRPRESSGNPSGPVSSVSQLRQTMAALTGVTADLLVVDRQTGQRFDRSLKNV